jgi:hypothetical protein
MGKNKEIMKQVGIGNNFRNRTPIAPTEKGLTNGTASN